MRNYRFAIVQYDPAEEFKLELREQVQRLSADLIANGWMILFIDLQESCSSPASAPRAPTGWSA